MVTGLARSGASTGALVAFFLGNPTLNPAVLVFLVFTLGWQWAVLRLVLGIALVFGCAALAGRFAPALRGSVTNQVGADEAVSAKQPSAWYARWLRSFGGLALRLMPEYILIVGLLGAARAFLFPVVSLDFANDPLVLIGFAIAGMLFVIPTAGEIPIVHTLRLSGLGAGPAGALLLTLAPVSLPSLLMVSRVLPARVLALLAGATVLAGLAGGGLALLLGL